MGQSKPYLNDYSKEFAGFVIGSIVELKPPMTGGLWVRAEVTALSVRFKNTMTHRYIVATFVFEKHPFRSKPIYSAIDRVSLSSDTDWKMRKAA